MISTRQPIKAPRMRLLRGGRRSWLQRFWDVEELFELKLTLLAIVSLLSATLAA